jgi:hypothetical protein
MVGEIYGRASNGIFSVFNYKLHNMQAALSNKYGTKLSFSTSDAI